MEHGIYIGLERGKMSVTESEQGRGYTQAIVAEDPKASYHMLLECWLTGQMTAGQLDRHRKEDSGFDAFIVNALGWSNP